MTVGSLFAGIGGFDLGFKRAGYDVRWQVEINGYCRAVLRKHWPDVRRYADVRRVGRHNLEPVDVLCGGFPCQDISVAGAGAGLAGARSGLWGQYARIIRELRPSYVVVENVSALLGRGLGTVLGDLAESGYDAEWRCIPASAVGAWHERDRLWIVAHAHGVRELQPQGLNPDERRRHHHSTAADAAHIDRSGPQERFVFARVPGPARCDDDGQNATLDPWRTTEPALVRGIHGVPARVDRIRGLGNAIVPQIAEWIAHRITEAEAMNEKDLQNVTEGV